MGNSSCGICPNRVWKVNWRLIQFLVGNFKHQEDLKMYGRLPDYGEFRGYDLGVDSGLSQIDEEIYANFYKPSRGALRRHLFLVGNPGKLHTKPQNSSGE